MPTILPYDGHVPDIKDALFIAETASIIGDVALAQGVSVWYGAVLRGDVHMIRVGENTSIQDNCVLHGDYGKWPVMVGARVTVGHGAILHGTVVEDDCVVGLGSILMNGSVIGTGSVVAAGSVVLEGTHIPPRSLVAGVPAKVKRQITDEELEKFIRHSWEVYLDYARKAKESLNR